MTFQKLAAATAALSLAVSPVVAQAADRAAAPVEGESNLEASTIVLALLAAAAIIGGIIIAVGGDDDDVISA